LVSEPTGLTLDPLIKRYLFHIHMFDCDCDCNEVGGNCDLSKEVYFSEFVPDSLNMEDYVGQLTVTGNVIVKHSDSYTPLTVYFTDDFLKAGW
jgi:hypothetical protein